MKTKKLLLLLITLVFMLVLCSPAFADVYGYASASPAKGTIWYDNTWSTPTCYWDLRNASNIPDNAKVVAV